MAYPGSPGAVPLKLVASLLFCLLIATPVLPFFSTGPATQARSPMPLEAGAAPPRAAGSADPDNVTLLPDYYEYIYLNDSYAGSIRMDIAVTSNVTVGVYVMDQAQFGVFRSTGFAAGIFESSGTNVTNYTSLPSSGIYYLVVWNHIAQRTATVRASYSTVPVNVFAFNPSLPAALGLTDYGVELTGAGAEPYTEVYDGVLGTANISAISAYNATAPPPIDADGASLDLAVNLQVNTTKGDFTYWVQDVATFRTSLHTYYISSEVFNFSAPDANLTSADISGNGEVYPYSPECLRCTHQNTYIYDTSTAKYLLPFDVQMPITVSQDSTSVAIKFAYGLSEGGGVGESPSSVFDVVTIKEPGTVLSSGFVVDGYRMNPAGSYSDAEFTFGGEYDGEATTFTQMSSVLNLLFQTSRGALVQPRSLWEFGSDTAEAAYNLQTTYASGQFSVGLGESGYDENYLLPGIVVVPLTLSFSIEGGAPSKLASPTLTYVHNGATETVALTSTPTVYYADNGTEWTVTSPFPNNSTQRWVTLGTTSGDAVAALSTSLVYYHQYDVAFDYAGGGPGYAPPSVTYEQFGQEVQTPVGAQVWTDAGSPYEYPAALTGSNSTVRYYAPAPNGTVPSAAMITVLYFHQFSFNATYSLAGGGSPGAPVVSSKTFGLAENFTLSTSGSALWLDAGSPWSVTNPLPGSSGTERWLTPSASSGVVKGPIAISLTYYHQFFVMAAYSVTGGGSPGQPDLNSTSLGSPSSVEVAQSGASAWLDAGASYSLTNPLPGSGNSERWLSPAPESGVVSGALDIQAHYYHQFLTQAGYSVAGGGSPQPPVFSSESFGTTSSRALSPSAQAIWLDADSSWSVTNPLNGSTSTERWLATSPSSGTISAPSVLNITFYHEFFITIAGPAAGGAVSEATGWHKAGSSVTLTASASSGWKFEGWTGAGEGSYSGPDNSTAVAVTSAFNETATFFPGLTLYVAGGGTITYAFGSTSGTITGSGTIYAPQGTSISLTATPSFLNSFSSWTGAASGPLSSTAFLLTGPSSATATFTYDYYAILAIIGVVVVVAVAVVVALRRRGAPSP